MSEIDKRIAGLPMSLKKWAEMCLLLGDLDALVQLGIVKVGDTDLLADTLSRRLSPPTNINENRTKQVSKVHGLDVRNLHDTERR